MQNIKTSFSISDACVMPRNTTTRRVSSTGLIVSLLSARAPEGRGVWWDIVRSFARQAWGDRACRKPQPALHPLTCRVCPKARKALKNKSVLNCAGSNEKHKTGLVHFRHCGPVLALALDEQRLAAQVEPAVAPSQARAQVTPARSCA